MNLTRDALVVLGMVTFDRVLEDFRGFELFLPFGISETYGMESICARRASLPVRAFPLISTVAWMDRRIWSSRQRIVDP